MQRQKRPTWHVRRTGAETPTGQQRWDQAYQLLLRWAMTPPAPTEAPAALTILPEVSHAYSNLRSRLDQPSG
jgi:hypothetical protein